MNVNNENMIYLFHAESVDLLDGMEESLLYLQNKGYDAEHINSIFRAIHTLKGGAAVFKFSILVDFSHQAESLLGKIREEQRMMSDALITLLLQVKDHLNNMIENIIQNDEVENYDAEITQETESLKKQLMEHLQATSDNEPQEELQKESLEKENLQTSQEKPTQELQTVEKITVSQNTPTVKQASTLKIESHKIDRIINLLGEMVITSAGIKEHSNRLKDKGLKDSVDSLYKILEELREASMKTRMVPVGNTFNRYKRVVRDLSMELGKDVSLVLVGAETELDKTIIEKISDPIMHLVRNALDHGIETPEQRKEFNKPSMATITLSASHEAGNIIIKVKDDGRGLDRDKIFAKALEMGLVKESDILSDREIYNLILEAGFSTAQTLSNISGRGVGMDVVKQNIEELKGSLEINSRFGKGSTIIIRLPLTLAIIDGFMVNISKNSYIVPLEMIQECIELREEYKESIRENGFIQLRDHVLPILDLRRFFDYEIKGNHKENIVVVYFGSSKVGLVVDELLGEFQTVIKPMSVVFKNLKGIGGATILGDGKVAPILDIPVLLRYANKKYK